MGRQGKRNGEGDEHDDGEQQAVAGHRASGVDEPRLDDRAAR